MVLVVGSSQPDRRPGSAGPAPVFSSKMVRLARCRGGVKGLAPAMAKVISSVGTSRPQVIHVFTGAGTLLGVSTLLAGRLFGRVTAMSIFGREDVSQTTLSGRTLFILACDLATSISTNSSATGRLLSPRFRGKTTVLLGGSAPPAQGGPGSPEGKSVLFVGRLVMRKGVDDLLRAVAGVKEKVPEARLVIVGDGPERGPLMELTSELALSGSVDFKGTLVGGPLSQEYRRCSLCVLPSKDVANDSATEGLGLALVEASMHGRPLVGTYHGGIVEVVQDGFNGLLVPQGDPGKLGEAIARLLADERLSSEMGANALSIANSQFTLKAATDRLLESYAR